MGTVVLTLSNGCLSKAREGRKEGRKATDILELSYSPGLLRILIDVLIVERTWLCDLRD